MTDITKMGIGQLLEDLDYYAGDKAVCEMTVKVGILETDTMDVVDRLVQNIQVIGVIERELFRRSRESNNDNQPDSN